MGLWGLMGWYFEKSQEAMSDSELRLNKQLLEKVNGAHFRVICVPGDSKWPFNPPVGGHLTI